jgi:regulator of sirC expression with transglutaminase-like and TPR domain
LRSRLENATTENLPSVYAEEGVWLDTLTALSALIEARPKDKALQEERAALLEQVGLTNAAMYATSQTTSD